LQIRRAILLAEADQWDEADQALQIVDDAQPQLADLVRRAYGDREHHNGSVADDRDTARLRPGWARERLELRLAEKRGDFELAGRVRESSGARDSELVKRTTTMTLCFVVPCALGLLVLCVWLLRNRPEIVPGSVAIPPPWSWERGFAILARSAFAGLAISTLLYVASTSFDLELLTVWTTFFASIPMMWWILHYLVEPSRLGLIEVFGFAVSARGIAGWIGLVLAVIAIDQLGTAVITVALRAAGVEPHWSEFVQESFVFGSTPFATLSFIDGAVWAPLFEEVGCRGLLYLTIRRRLGSKGAALFSAMLFGAVHLYSLPGFLSVCWSGVVYALAVEKCRSLLPAMSAHAFNNAFALGAAWLFYR
jgi:membrane protease YdiL (CAAX protease family)